jgi:uncharacterized protein DUF3443
MKNLKTSRWTVRASLSGVLLGVALIAGCGGGGGGGGTPPPTLQNVATVTVDGEYNSFNSLFVTLKICQHGSTSNCVTVDHVTIDTGSIGLRVLANSLNSLNPTFLTNLPTVTETASSNANLTGPLAECEQFGGGYTWGSVRNVDITISGTNETASNVPMQVIGDFGVSQPTCASESVTGYQLTGEDYTNNTANPLTNEYLGGNGLIGVSLFQWDCLGCITDAQPMEGDPATPTLAYVVCPDTTGNGCQPTTAALTEQVANPISSFATDNNGYIIAMDAVTATAGSSTAVSGTMTFGIGTQSNNAIGSATTFQADPDTEPGVINTTWQGTVYDGLFDTGSSAFYFTNTTNPTIALCGTMAPDNEIYCPGGANATMNGAGTTVNLSATIQDYLGDASPSSLVNFSVTNPLANYTNSTIAADNIGGTVVFHYFIWGMPYFYGHKLYFGMAGINGTTLMVTRNPFYAF